MSKLHTAILLAAAILLFPSIGRSQYIQKVSLNTGDSTDYYLAVPPTGKIGGVLVLLCAYRGPESILPETRLHNVAAANSILTVYASLGTNFLPDDGTMTRIDKLCRQVMTKYEVYITSFVLAGWDLAGTAALRYTELSQEHPERFAVHPKVVFTIASNVDLAGLYRQSERVIRKNYYPPTVGDAKIYLDLLKKNAGDPDAAAARYRELSPFSAADTPAGNERWLKNVAVRLYYDADIGLQLKTRRNGYYETDLPDAAEMIDRLMLAGNKKAEFVASKQPAYRSNGSRSPYALSIVDETDCIQWIKKELGIFDPANPMAFIAPYRFEAPEGWAVERSGLPPRWAPALPLKGIEEIRFAPGWGIQGREDYWSLDYMFWLDGGQKVDAGVIRDNLQIYFDGLIRIGGGSTPHNIPPDKLMPTRVEIRKIGTEADDKETFSGTISMLDYKILQPMRLNFLAHIKDCPAQNHIALFVELSPKPLTDGLWQDLKRPKQHFDCGD